MQGGGGEWGSDRRPPGGLIAAKLWAWPAGATDTPNPKRSPRRPADRARSLEGAPDSAQIEKISDKDFDAEGAKGLRALVIAAHDRTDREAHFCKRSFVATLPMAPAAPPMRIGTQVISAASATLTFRRSACRAEPAARPG